MLEILTCFTIWLWLGQSEELGQTLDQALSLLDGLLGQQLSQRLAPAGALGSQDHTGSLCPISICPSNLHYVREGFKKQPLNL